MTETPTTPPATELVEAYLRAHPGQHRPADVARALGRRTSDVANTLAYMARQGRVVRHRNPEVRNGPGASTYALT